MFSSLLKSLYLEAVQSDNLVWHGYAAAAMTADKGAPATWTAVVAAKGIATVFWVHGFTVDTPSAACIPTLAMGKGAPPAAEDILTGYIFEAIGIAAQAVPPHIFPRGARCAANTAIQARAGTAAGAETFNLHLVYAVAVGA